MTNDSEFDPNQGERLAAERDEWDRVTTPEYRRYLGEEVDAAKDLALRLNRISRFQNLPQGSELPKVRVLCAKGHLIFTAHGVVEYSGNVQQDGREVPYIELVVGQLAASASGERATILDASPHVPVKWVAELSKTDDELGEHRSTIHCSLCPKSRIVLRESNLRRRYVEAVILGKRSLKIEGDTQR